MELLCAMCILLKLGNYPNTGLPVLPNQPDAIPTML